MKIWIMEQIRLVLQREGCSLAVIFGSFLEEGRRFRDIDVMVAMEAGRAPTLGELLHLAQLLEKETGYRFDVVGVDIPGILIRAEIARKGQPIIVEDSENWVEFQIRALLDEMDFRPLIERFYEERFGIECRRSECLRRS